MKINEIKGIVPGAGKTTILVKTFIKSNLKNKLILTPSNKARQEVISKLIDFGYSNKKAEKSVKTMRKFKRNFFKHYTTTEVFDIESGEYIKEPTNIRYISKESEKHYGKTWNLFIDESSMFSDKEMKDLISNFKVKNLILCGDSLQFDPIGKNEILESEKEKWVWEDEGKPYELNPDTQILLAKNMRSQDEELKKVLELIKKGTVDSTLEALEKVRKHSWEKENHPNDWHIAYTNKKCDNLNKMYTSPQRYIVTHSDEIHGFYKSEILEKDSLRLKELEQNLFYEKVKNPKTPDFEEWKKNYLKPAYGLTCHKLQGSTIKEGQIFVHIDDLIHAMSAHIDSYEEKARLFQKYLYVAFSRATSINQLNLFGSMGVDKVGNKYVLGLSEKLMKDEEFSEEFFKILKHVQPMYDPSIRANCKVFEDYDEALQYILDNLDYSDDPVELEGEKEWREKISKAHSGEHKRKYNDEFLRNISKKELYKMTKNAKIRKRWNELNYSENIPCNSVTQNPAINLHAGSDSNQSSLNSSELEIPPKK